MSDVRRSSKSLQVIEIDSEDVAVSDTVDELLLECEREEERETLRVVVCEKEPRERLGETVGDEEREPDEERLLDREEETVGVILGVQHV